MSKYCRICRKDLSKWNLDFTREIVCDSCLLGTGEQKASKIKTSNEETEISLVKKLYEAIIERKIIGVLAIQCLENVTGYDFINTKDFSNKMEKFLSKHFYRGADLQKVRKWSGMEQSDLADWFGISIQTIKRMETNRKPLSQNAINFIRVMGCEKKVPLKKMKVLKSKIERVFK